ncbi:hypothetical protein ACNUDN_29530 [Mycobacterium sp. smrl_JER01]|jgi:hypothetical protein|uniref:Uncharacterized protein n=2 Tax=Mycobacteriaceae TaxID=1762 RepID=A0A1Y0CHB3_9MYCO|nr:MULTISPECIES: hypothetical protein [Mycobacterium]ART74532.1 hypothetical protein BTO20_38740 [Mycobacterium dioxanotrophicus]GAY17274.1 hypothetical protein MSZK_40000 [Mycobacterium sp. shizuoka-1]
MSGITQVLLNLSTEVRGIIIAVITIIALIMSAVVFAQSRGSVTKVLVVLASSVVAGIVVWQLPDLIRLGVSDAPNLTGINSRY